MSFIQSQINLSFFFGAKRTIQDIAVDCIISEDTTDTLTITKQPVQTGAAITDHSFLEPVILNMQILQQVGNPVSQLLGTFSGYGLQQLYDTFIQLQKLRTPFTVSTPKRIYDDMLISSLKLHTDKETENILSLYLSFQQVFFVSVGTIFTQKQLLKTPQKNQGVKKTGKQALVSDSITSGVEIPFETFIGLK